MGSDYQRYLAQAATVADCQRIYEQELDRRGQEYRQRDPQNYRPLLAAHEVDYWILAENRAQQLAGQRHSYGSLISRRSY
ncbi:MAG: hypothetical protein ACFN06_01780 [Limosilactobacillus oris]